MKVTSYSATGTKAADFDLSNKVFGLDVNHELVGLAYRARLANQRTNNAAARTRGEVSGGGKKPYRQKGTGRARTGSIRNPLWRGGGTVFGPTGLENYRLALPKKMNRAAIAQALSAQAKDNKIVVIDSLSSADGRVKPMTTLLGSLGVEGGVLLVTDQKNDLLDRATRNLAGVKLIAAHQLTVVNVLDADVIVLAKPAVTVIDQWLTGKAIPPAKPAATQTVAKPAQTEAKS